MHIEERANILNGDEPFANALQTIWRSLSYRERRILSMRYGLDGTQRNTLREVGHEFNLTRERIRQIEQKALAYFRHPEIRSLISEASVRQLQMITIDAGEWNAPSDVLAAALSSYSEDFPSSENWISFMAELYRDLRQFRSIEDYLQAPRLRLDYEIDRNGGFIEVQDFVDLMIDRGINSDTANLVTTWLRRTDSKYAWVDEAIVVPRYIEIAKFILWRANEALHWREISERAMKFEFDRKINPYSIHNVLVANDAFVYRGPGTYGLRDWGLERKRFQKDVLVSWFRQTDRNSSIGEIEYALSETEDAILHSSLSFYLHIDPLFFQDVDGNFGLREWLPPEDEQWQDAPRSLQESSGSRKRLRRR